MMETTTISFPEEPESSTGGMLARDSHPFNASERRLTTVGSGTFPARDGSLCSPGALSLETVEGVRLVLKC